MTYLHTEPAEPASPPEVPTPAPGPEINPDQQPDREISPVPDEPTIPDPQGPEILPDTTPPEISPPGYFSAPLAQAWRHAA
jgi:hypothetical protein